MESGERTHVEKMLGSTLESVDSAETLVLEAARNAGFDEDDLHKVGIAVRETMVNAVAHGNRYSGRKKVRLSIRTDSDRLVIEIQDEGSGFERTTVPDPLAEENLLRHSGRGLLMIQAFMDELEILPVQPVGTCVRMTKYLPGAQPGNQG
jgi:serine/threonine-protein kinase RsbW